MESAMENETQQDTRAVTDNITAGIPVETTVHDGDATGVNEVVVETNPDDSLITTDDFCDDDDENVVCQVAQDIDDLEMVKTALESYETILQSMLDRDGEISAPVMMAVNKGLECFGLEPITNRFVSLEDVTGSSLVVRQAASDDYVGRVKENVSSTGKKIAEAFRKFIEWVQNFYRTWLANGTNKIRQITKLRDRISKTKNFEPVTINNPRALMTGTTFVLEDEQAFDKALNMFVGAMKFSTVTGPNIAGGYFTALDELIKEHGAKYFEDVPDEIFNDIGEEFTLETMKYMRTVMHRGTSELNVEGEYLVSDALPGNYYMYFQKRDYNGFPYAYVGFEQSSDHEVPHQVELVLDSRRAKHYTEGLRHALTSIERNRGGVNALDRFVLWSATAQGNKNTTAIRMIKGLMGEVAPVMGQFDRFVNATCKAIERSIVE